MMAMSSLRSLLLGVLLPAEAVPHPAWWLQGGAELQRPWWQGRQHRDQGEQAAQLGLEVAHTISSTQHSVTLMLWSCRPFQKPTSRHEQPDMRRQSLELLHVVRYAAQFEPRLVLWFCPFGFESTADTCLPCCPALQALGMQPHTA